MWIFLVGVYANLQHAESSSLTGDQTPGPLHWACGVLATGPPEKPPYLILLSFALLPFLQSESLWQPCLKQAYQHHCSHSICSFGVSVSYSGNSCTISSFHYYYVCYGDLRSMMFVVTAMSLTEGSAEMASIFWQKNIFSWGVFFFIYYCTINRLQTTCLVVHTPNAGGLGSIPG